MPTNRPLDVAIIGAGIAGVVHLHYARRAGLDAAVFEAQEGVGGLWRQLPAWQDIQISTADWALGDIPLAGPMQPQVLANIEAWVTRFGLADGIRLGTRVLQARPADQGWELQTAAGTVRARHLVAATGAHNKPVVSEVERHASRVRERHSSQLREPSELAGQAVLVVGAGASALDLLDQCLEQGARRIVWVYRSQRWFTPTRKPKAIAGTVRPYARMQASGMTAAQQNAAIGADMRARYEKFGITDILPQRPLDVLHDQLIPGRARMLEHFAALERHPGRVAAIDGNTVLLADGETKLDGIDVLLWGTGYAADLSSFAVPPLAAIRSVNELGARCGGGLRSLDAPNLYFPGVGLDGIGAAPWAYALMARTIMSHIKGTARLDMEVVPHRLNHFDLVNYLGPRDPASFVPGEWQEQFRKLAMETPDAEPYPMP
ncbi:flavin-containing monooxygenase [Caenimonas terrae]|uniref:Flavin-containing monooxygenase n=1 Tax=Caenimonas terrae TaxID=696074 RepID=A0ABW0NAR4_9BURK